MNPFRMVTAVTTAVIAIVILTSTLTAQGSDSTRYWAQWRGPHASGVSTTADPPLEWSETKNVRWKTLIPGRGHASPVVWGDRIFVLTAVPVVVIYMLGQRFMVVPYLNSNSVC